MAQKNTCIIFLAENGNVITTSKSTLTPFGGPKTQVLLKKKKVRVFTGLKILRPKKCPNQSPQNEIIYPHAVQINAYLNSQEADYTFCSVMLTAPSSITDTPL